MTEKQRVTVILAILAGLFGVLALISGDVRDYIVTGVLVVGGISINL